MQLVLVWVIALLGLGSDGAALADTANGPDTWAQIDAGEAVDDELDDDTSDEDFDEDDREAVPFFEVANITYGGSGCPQGWGPTLNHEDDRLEIVYDDLISEASTHAGTRRRSCSMSVELDYPDGWTYAVANTSVTGEVSLERGEVANQTTKVYFAGHSQNAVFRHRFRGPVDDTFDRHDRLSLVELQWAPCGERRNLNLTTSVEVSPRSESMLSVEEETLHLIWRRCN